MDAKKPIDYRVKGIIIKVLGIAGPIENNDRLDELGTDSVDLAEICTRIESEFGFEVNADVADGWNSIGDIIRSIKSKIPPRFTQSDVDTIVARAKELGAGAGLTYKHGHLKLSNYGKPHGPEALAMLLINGWHEKYDLVCATQALIEFLCRKKEA